MRERVRGDRYWFIDQFVQLHRNVFFQLYFIRKISIRLNHNILENIGKSNNLLAWYSICARPQLESFGLFRTYRKVADQIYLYYIHLQLLDCWRYEDYSPRVTTKKWWWGLPEKKKLISNFFYGEQTGLYFDAGRPLTPEHLKQSTLRNNSQFYHADKLTRWP